MKIKSLSPSTRKNLITCVIVLLVVALILWLTFKPVDNKSCSRSPVQAPVQEQPKLIIPIGNGQSVALTKEQYEKLKESYGGKREGFYVSNQDYIPNVRTENEYTPMLSLYKPKETTRVIPEPVPGPVMPIPIPGANTAVMTGATGPVEGYGNVFIDNFSSPSVDPELEKYRQELTGISPFFLNNGKIVNGEAI